METDILPLPICDACEYAIQSAIMGEPFEQPMCVHCAVVIADWAETQRALATLFKDLRDVQH